MKFTVNRTELLAAAQNAERIAPRVSTIEILQCAYLQAVHAEAVPERIIRPEQQQGRGQQPHQQPAPAASCVVRAAREHERGREERPVQQLQVLPHALVDRREDRRERIRPHVVQKMQRRPAQNGQREHESPFASHKRSPLS